MKDAPGVYKKHYTLRDAVLVLFRARIKELAKETSGAKAGNTVFLAKDSDALKMFTTNLTPEERKQATDLAAEWNENGLPKHVQAECVLLLPRMLIIY